MKQLVFLILVMFSYLVVGQNTALDSLYEPGKFDKIEYYNDSTIKEVYNVDLFGKRHGKFYSFYIDGSLWGYGEFKHGKKHGQWGVYRLSNNRVGYYQYSRGKRVGIWLIYDENGDIVSSRNY